MDPSGRAIEQTLNWLLEPQDPNVRYLALRDLLEAPPNDPQLLAARKDAYTQGPIAAILAAMHPEGFWVRPGPGYTAKYRSAVWSLTALAQLGASAAHDERIARACAYVLDHALAEGARFSYNGAPSGTFDCLQGNLCAALFSLGYADPRLEQAFDWMARSVTGEEEQAVRYFASGNVGPLFACSYNGGQPCAWGGVKVMLAFGRLPAGQRTPPIRAGHPGRAGFPFQRRSRPGDLPHPARTPNPAATGGSSASRSSTSPTCCKTSRCWSGWAAGKTHA